LFFDVDMLPSGNYEAVEASLNLTAQYCMPVDDSGLPVIFQPWQLVSEQKRALWKVFSWCCEE